MAKRPGKSKSAGRKRTSRTAATAGSRKPATRRAARPKARTTRAGTRSATIAALAPMTGVDTRVIAGVQLDIARAGAARVKRVIYPAGFHWARHMKPITGTDLCMHAHVGFLAHGEIHIEYADGCVVEHKAPQIVAIEPGHDGWVVGRGPAVLIEFDFERDTIALLGMPDAHRHG